MTAIDATSHHESSGGPVSAGVSVILPTYNRANYLASAIHSILHQSVPLRDVIVVDDGSQDTTAEVVAAFGDQVTFIRQENAGKLAAIKRGLDHARGDLVWIMDDDDLADPRAVEMLLQPFGSDPACIMTYGGMSRFEDGREDRGEDTLVEYPVDDDRPFFVRLMEDCFITGHPCVLVRRTALEEMRPFRPDVVASVDYYLHLGVAQRGRTIFVDYCVLRQRQHHGPRGPQAHQYSAAERNEKWTSHDRMLIEPLIEKLPLGAYIHYPEEPGFRADVTEPSNRRRALFQRGVIAARKKLWPLAFDAFREAVDIAPYTPLQPEELDILSKALGCRYGIDEVHNDPDIPAQLRRIAARRTDSSPFLVAISRPLLHELKIAYRERDPSRAQDAVRTWRRLMTQRANVAAVGAVLRRNSKRIISG